MVQDRIDLLKAPTVVNDYQFALIETSDSLVVKIEDNSCSFMPTKVSSPSTKMTIVRNCYLTSTRVGYYIVDIERVCFKKALDYWLSLNAQ